MDEGRKCWIRNDGKVYDAPAVLATGADGRAFTLPELAARIAEERADERQKCFAATPPNVVSQAYEQGRLEGVAQGLEMAAKVISNSEAMSEEEKSYWADRILSIRPSASASEDFRFTAMELVKHDIMRMDQGFVAGVDTAIAITERWLSAAKRMGGVSSETIRAVERLVTRFADKRPAAAPTREQIRREVLEEAIRAIEHFHGENCMGAVNILRDLAEKEGE